jgi:uncharacterized iron-regulated membrane protein
MTFASWLCTGGVVGVLSGLTLWWTVARFRPGAPRRHAITQEVQELAAGAGLIGPRSS